MPSTWREYAIDCGTLVQKKLNRKLTTSKIGKLAMNSSLKDLWWEHKQGSGLEPGAHAHSSMNCFSLMINFSFLWLPACFVHDLQSTCCSSRIFLSNHPDTSNWLSSLWIPTHNIDSTFYSSNLYSWALYSLCHFQLICKQGLELVDQGFHSLPWVFIQEICRNWPKMASLSGIWEFKCSKSIVNQMSTQITLRCS